MLNFWLNYFGQSCGLKKKELKVTIIVVFLFMKRQLKLRQWCGGLGSMVWLEHSCCTGAVTGSNLSQLTIVGP